MNPNGWLLLSNLLLLAVVAGIGIVVLSLARQIGVLHERTSPLGLARQTPRIRIGDRLPPLVAPNLLGDDVDLDVIAAGGTHVALLFVATDCPICRTLAPAFWRRTRAGGTGLVGYLVCDAATQAFHDHAAAAGVDAAHCLVSRLLALQLQVRLLPFLVVMDPDGRLVVREVVQGARGLDRTLSAIAVVQTD